MSQEHECPRRSENPLVANRFPGPDEWLGDDTCSYCGSLNPDVFMARLEAGDVRLEPTDKNYKVYVANEGGAPFQQQYKDAVGHSWMTRQVQTVKFYFQHLSPEQQQRFVELYNSRKIKLTFPGHFYTLPFFCSVQTDK